MNNEIIDITGNQEHTISKALEYWTKTSERYREFVERYKEKIRKKCHTARTYEDIEDIRFELEIPFLLLLDDRFTVDYERYGMRISQPFPHVLRFKIHKEVHLHERPF